MTEEYFNQLVDYYKEALTNSMVNEGSRGQARQARRTAKTVKTKGIGPDLSNEIARENIAATVRNIRILSPHSAPEFRNAVASEVGGNSVTKTLMSGLAQNIAADKRWAASQARGKSYPTPDAGERARIQSSNTIHRLLRKGRNRA